MNDFVIAESNSVHAVKVLLCFLLERLKHPVNENQLYEIVMDSEVINYFYYMQALDELLKNGSVTKTENGGSTYIKLEEKGRLGADYFNDTVPYYFRKKLLKAALSYFSRLRRESETDIEIAPTKGGCEVRCTIRDDCSDLMKIALYAPDEEQARLIKEKILLAPEEFYRRVIGFVLDNEEKLPDIDSQL